MDRLRTDEAGAGLIIDSELLTGEQIAPDIGCESLDNYRVNSVKRWLLSLLICVQHRQINALSRPVLRC